MHSPTHSPICLLDSCIEALAAEEHLRQGWLQLRLLRLVHDMSDKDDLRHLETAFRSAWWYPCEGTILKALPDILVHLCLFGLSDAGCLFPSHVHAEVQPGLYAAQQSDSQLSASWEVPSIVWDMSVKSFSVLRVRHPWTYLDIFRAVSTYVHCTS